MSGRLLPLYFEMPLLREHVWFQPMLVYVTAALLQVLPLTQSAVRLPSAAIGTLDVLLLYFLASRLFCSRWYGLAAATLRSRATLRTFSSSKGEGCYRVIADRPSM